MKRFLSFALIVMGLLSSCQKEDVIEKNKNLAITFDNAFVDNVTRSEIGTENFNEFTVYGYKTYWGGTFWGGERVYLDKSGAWTYDNLAYWEEQSSYYFHAFAPYLQPTLANHWWTFTPDQNATGGPVTGKIEVSSVDGDLVYASYERDVEELDGTPEPIELTFKHLLSRVRIRIVNELSNKHARVHVNNFQTSPMICEGTATVPFDGEIVWKLGDALSAHAWALKDNEDPDIIIYHKDLGINTETTGELVTNSFFVMPQTWEKNKYLFSFEMQYYLTQEPGKNVGVVASMNDDFEFKPGMSYQFTVSVKDSDFYDADNLIKFKVEVEEWSEWADVDHGYNN